MTSQVEAAKLTVVLQIKPYFSYFRKYALRRLLGISQIETSSKLAYLQVKFEVSLALKLAGMRVFGQQG